MATAKTPGTTLSHPTQAIVTDGLWRKSLSAIRSLGKAGYRVTVLGDSWWTTGFWSRFTSRRILAPLAGSNPHRFGQALFHLLEKNPGSVILPMEDPTLEWLSQNRAKVEKAGAKFLIPPPEALKIAQDKGLTMEAAEKLKLPCPKTWKPATAAAFAELALSLKPGSFVAKPRSGTGSSGVLYGTALSRQAWMEHWLKHGPMLVQERIAPEGRGQGVSLLFDGRGNCVAAFAHERLEQYPNSGGPSTDRKSIHASELVVWSMGLLKELGWRGIGMVEWKIDPVDGVPKLMEINPRFWGSLELAVRAGIDFPTLYARAASGEKLEPHAQYAAGVRCRWMIPGEILRYFSQPPEKREGLRKFLSGLPGLAEEWDRRDIRGFFATVFCTLALALNPRYWKYVRRG